ncbi:MAG: exosortase/archaeosortase family protein [Candidatus Bathyarchaeota archaeon]|nr:exosortase/archaeosortase family protein [Candidatus Bathyarchaeota archaeon]
MQDAKLSSAKMASPLNQHRLVVALKVSVLALALLAFYFQDLTLVFKGAISDESTFHILAIPFIFTYFIYRKRKMLGASIYSNETENKHGFLKYSGLLVGITLSAVSVLLYWYGSYTFTPLEYHVITLPFFAAGLILILFNTQMLKQMLFPVAFLIFLTPPPSEILYGVGSALANLSAIASNGLANVFGFNATLSSSDYGPMITILRPDGTSLPFNVSVACSGIYSIIGFMIFAVFIAYITKGKLLNKLIILILGIPLIIGLNITRITTILGIAYNWGEDLALQVFHTFGATVLMFIGTLILLGVTEKVFKKPPAPQICPACTPTPKNLTLEFCSNCGKIFKTPKIRLNKIDIAKVAGVVLVIIALLSIQAPVFALTEGPAEIMIQAPSGTQVTPSNSSLPAVKGYNLNYVYRDVSFEQTSGNDAALVYCYSPTNSSASAVWVAVQIAESSTSQHRWETCLINFPLSQGEEATVEQLDLQDIQLQDNPPLMARYFAFRYLSSGQMEVVLYWFETATFDVNGTAQTKSVMMSLIMYPQSVDEISSCEAQELPIAQAINDFWQPIRSWSVVSLAISQNGLLLSIGAASVLMLIIIYSIFLNRKEKMSLLTMYQKLPVPEQYLIKAVEAVGEQKSTQAIAEEYSKLSNMPTSEAAVMEKLNAAEKAGLVARTLANRNDSPVQVWQSRLPKSTGFFLTRYF